MSSLPSRSAIEADCCEPSPDHRVVREPHSAAAQKPAKSGARFVLFAEDDPEDQLLVSDAWKHSQSSGSLVFVSDGEELLEFLRKRDDGAMHTARLPDLVMLDLNMPRLDGREALREIRADALLQPLPVVVFSTSGADRDVLAAYRLGANSYVTKPESFAALVQVFRVMKAYWLEAALLRRAAIAECGQVDV